MCTTQFDLFTYNCHLFVSIPAIRLLPTSLAQDLADAFTKQIFQDTDRVEAITRYIRTKQYSSTNPVIPIVALQEVWDAMLVDDSGDLVDPQSIPEHVDDNHHGTLNNRYRLNGRLEREQYIGHAGDLKTSDPKIFTPELEVVNPNGLLLLADRFCTFNKQSQEAFNYINGCTVGSVDDCWDGQDQWVAKGFLRTECSWPCATKQGAMHTIALYTTHMPTNYGSRPAVGCCFSALANDIISWQNGHSATGGANSGSALFMLGDLNIDFYADSNQNPGVGDNKEYTEALTNTLLKGTGLVDLTAASKPPSPVVTVSNANTLWQHFNSGSKTVAQRIDYILCADSIDGTSMKVSLTPSKDGSPSVLAVRSPDLQVHIGGKSYDCSDHYPLEAMVTVTIPDSVCSSLPT